MFGTSEDYHDLNAGALRNSPKNLSAPALTWHLAFWIKKHSSSEEEDYTDISAVKCVIDSFLIGVCRSLKDDGVDVKILPSIGKHSLLFVTVVDRFQFDEIKRPNLSQRQDDIFQSTVRGVAVKFKWNMVDVTIRCEVRSELFTITTFAELAKYRAEPPYSTDSTLNSNLSAMQALLAGDESVDGAAVRSYFFREFWRSIYEGLMKYPAVADVCKKAPFASAFVDFRGIILSERVVRIPGVDEQLDGRAPLKWGEGAKSLLMPVLKIPGVDRYRNYECAVNYMLNGRALFMSTLVPQLPEAESDERIPTEYIVYAHQQDSRDGVVVNKWELGRLISQIHTLATVQLAALKDVKKLHEAGSRLAELDVVTQTAREQIANFPSKATQLIKDSHTRINILTRDFLRSTSCGLAYRIEQSRYYVAVFDSFLKFLRIQRLEGDQAYDEFIERRLGAEFDFIDRLGKRYESAKNSITMLDQNYIAINTAEVEDESQKTEHRIEKIQEWGEFALLAALVPYYVTGLLDRIFPNDERIRTISLVVWIFFGAIALYRILGKRGKLALVAPIVLALLMGTAALFALNGRPKLASPSAELASEQIAAPVVESSPQDKAPAGVRPKVN